MKIIYQRWPWSPKYVLEFRKDPIPHTGKKGGRICNWLRYPKTAQELRENTFDLKYSRGRRRNIPTAWDDQWRSDTKNWKSQRKIQYHNIKYFDHDREKQVVIYLLKEC